MRCAISLLCLVACRPTPAATAVAEPPPPIEAPPAAEETDVAEPIEPPPPGPDIGVREVDWSSFDYDGFVALSDGHGYLHEYMEDYGGMHDSTEWSLIGVAFGDLDGDGDDEAAIAIDESFWAPDGATSRGSVVFVFAGNPVQRLAGERLGSCDAIAIEDGQVVLTGKRREVFELVGERLLPADR